VFNKHMLQYILTGTLKIWCISHQNIIRNASTEEEKVNILRFIASNYTLMPACTNKWTCYYYWVIHGHGGGRGEVRQQMESVHGTWGSCDIWDLCLPVDKLLWSLPGVWIPKARWANLVLG
jgi:hypothetical protein